MWVCVCAAQNLQMNILIRGDYVFVYATNSMLLWLVGTWKWIIDGRAPIHILYVYCVYILFRYSWGGRRVVEHSRTHTYHFHTMFTCSLTTYARTKRTFFCFILINCNSLFFALLSIFCSILHFICFFFLNTSETLNGKLCPFFFVSLERTHTRTEIRTKRIEKQKNQKNKKTSRKGGLRVQCVYVRGSVSPVSRNTILMNHIHRDFKKKLKFKWNFQLEMIGVSFELELFICEN